MYWNGPWTGPASADAVRAPLRRSFAVQRAARRPPRGGAHLQPAPQVGAARVGQTAQETAAQRRHPVRF